MDSLLEADSAESQKGHPSVTMVFFSVDGGKQFVAKHRRDAEHVHQQLVAVMRSVLVQVEGNGWRGTLPSWVMYDV